MKNIINFKNILITVLLIPLIMILVLYFISSHTYLKLYSNESLINMLNTKNDLEQKNVLNLLVNIRVYNDKSYTPTLIKALRSNINNYLFLNSGSINSGELANKILNVLYNQNKFYYNGYNQEIYQEKWNNKSNKEIEKMNQNDMKEEAKQETEKTIKFWENAYINGWLK